MAENIVEIKPSTDEHDMADVPSVKDAANDEASSGRKEEPDTISIERTELKSPKEVLVILEKDKAESKSSLEAAEQQDACKTDCNGDPKEAADVGEEESSDNAISKTKEGNQKESNSVETKSSDESGMDYLPDVDERLSEILKVVHGDLHVNFLKSCVKASTKDDASKADDEKEQQTEAAKKTDISKDDTAMDSTNDCAASTMVKTDAEDEANSRESAKVEQRSELGIVGLPTAVSELINEEELGGDSTLSADQKEHIVEWVENSVKVKAEEENSHAEDSKMEYVENESADEGVKRRKINNAPIMVSRKSQKLVSSIIKRSIKW